MQNLRGCSFSEILLINATFFWGDYRIFVGKGYAYRNGIRPVMYLSEAEEKKLKIPSDEMWRVVRLQVEEETWVSWLHEREWRKKGRFRLPKDVGVLVKTEKEFTKLQEMIHDCPEEFKVKPRTFLPLKVICQGLAI